VGGERGYADKQAVKVDFSTLLCWMKCKRPRASSPRLVMGSECGTSCLSRRWEHKCRGGHLVGRVEYTCRKDRDEK